MKKKIIAIIGCMTLCMSLMACGQKAEVAEVEISEVEVPAVEETVEAEVVESTPEPTVEPEVEVEPEIEVTDADLVRTGYTVAPYYLDEDYFIVDEECQQQPEEVLDKEIMTEMIKRGYDMSTISVVKIRQFVFNEDGTYTYEDLDSGIININLDIDETKTSFSYQSFNSFLGFEGDNAENLPGENDWDKIRETLDKAYENMKADEDYEMIQFKFNPEKNFKILPEKNRLTTVEMTPNEFMNTVIYAMFENKTLDLCGGISANFCEFTLE